MAIARKLITEEEFLKLDLEGKAELVLGEIIMSPAGLEHGEIIANLTALLFPFAKKIGKIFDSSSGFRMKNGNIRCPDISIVFKDRFIQGKAPRGFFDGAPDIAVEVVSPNDRVSEMPRKMAEYFNSGAKQVWILEPDFSVKVADLFTFPV